VTTARQSLGRWGESLAAEYLSQLGYIILERNARTPYGEIDLVGVQPDRGTAPQSGEENVVVFFEVKTHASTKFGPPELSVTPRKQAHLRAAAQYYLQTHPELNTSWRIDVIAIERYRREEKPVIQHFENAVRD
jgi:putative endonuclease